MRQDSLALTQLPSTSVLLPLRKYIATTYTIRVTCFGFMCSDGIRRNIQLIWSCCRLADDHEYELRRCREYYQTRCDVGEMSRVLIVEGED